MAEIILARLIPYKNTPEGWADTNPLVPQGEFVVELGSPMLFKIGDGILNYVDLPYAGGTGAINPVIKRRIVCGSVLYPISGGNSIPAPGLNSTTILFMSLNKNELDSGAITGAPDPTTQDYFFDSTTNTLTVWGGLSNGDIIKVLTQEY